MNYALTTPCPECPFLRVNAKHYRRLPDFAGGEFPCHKTAICVEDDEGGAEYVEGPKSLHCAGALIYNEKRSQPHQMMRLNERLGFYDRTKLDMAADVV